MISWLMSNLWLKQVFKILSFNSNIPHNMVLFPIYKEEISVLMTPSMMQYKNRSIINFWQASSKISSSIIHINSHSSSSISIFIQEVLSTSSNNSISRTSNPKIFIIWLKIVVLTPINKILTKFLLFNKLWAKCFKIQLLQLVVQTQLTPDKFKLCNKSNS